MMTVVHVLMCSRQLIYYTYGVYQVRKLAVRQKALQYAFNENGAMEPHDQSDANEECMPNHVYTGKRTSDDEQLMEEDSPHSTGNIDDTEMQEISLENSRGTEKPIAIPPKEQATTECIAVLGDVTDSAQAVGELPEYHRCSHMPENEQTYEEQEDRQRDSLLQIASSSSSAGIRSGTLAGFSPTSAHDPRSTNTRVKPLSSDGTSSSAEIDIPNEQVGLAAKSLFSESRHRGMKNLKSRVAMLTRAL